jgi:transcriptional regulator with XRE-family HTH domain
MPTPIEKVSTSSVVSYEQAQKKPSFDVLLAISDKLNVSLDVLCGITTQPRTLSDVARHIAVLHNTADTVNGHIDVVVADDDYSIILHGWNGGLRERKTLV